MLWAFAVVLALPVAVVFLGIATLVWHDYRASHDDLPGTLALTASVVILGIFGAVGCALMFHELFAIFT